MDVPSPAAFRRDGARLVLTGRLDTKAAGQLWRPLLAAAEGAEALDISGVPLLDTTGATLVLEAAAASPGARIEGAGERVAPVIERVRAALAAPRPPPPPPPLPPISALGAAAIGGVQAAAGGIAFLGEAALAGLRVALRPSRLRGAEFLRHLDEAGPRAFPLALLLGALLGVILAFQSSIPMRRFGAEIFIPQLVGISLIRELGPLMAAVILAGRTGSAYAAELGTMKVNEEVDALRIMGIDPVSILVLPRLVAGVLVMPVLALLMNLAGLIGMGGVMAGLGFPPAMVISMLEQSISLRDLLGGLFKAACFGLAIAAIGCHAGLTAGRGPRAVGDAATAAVVGGIVSIVVMDGVFAVLFFRLGL
jgi:phospholipid/cholesterol/gamma-HCH transport system permease protein